MITIKHKLSRKADQIDATSLQLFVAVQEGLRITKGDVEEKLYEMFSEKASWFEVVIDQSVLNIRILPTADTLSSEEKMRLYRWFVDHHGHEIGEFAKNRIHINTRVAFRAEVGGVGFAY